MQLENYVDYIRNNSDPGALTYAPPPGLHVAKTQGGSISRPNRPTCAAAAKEVGNFLLRAASAPYQHDERFVFTRTIQVACSSTAHSARKAAAEQQWRQQRRSLAKPAPAAQFWPSTQTTDTFDPPDTNHTNAHDLKEQETNFDERKKNQIPQQNCTPQRAKKSAVVPTTPRLALE